MEEKHIGMEISKTNNLILRSCLKDNFQRMNAATGKNGWIIGYIASNPDKEIFQRDIEETFSIRRSTVSNMIKLMEQKGYVQRESVDYDARLKKLVLTPKALDMYRRVQQNILVGEQKMRANISDEELEVFFCVLQKIQQNLQE